MTVYVQKNSELYKSKENSALHPCNYVYDFGCGLLVGTETIHF